MAKSEINLLNKASGNQATVVILEKILSKLTWGTLTVLCVLGVIIGSLYLYASTQQKRQDMRKAQLVASLKELASKEGILVSLKQRSAIAAKALNAARPYGELFPLLERIAPSEYFTNLSIDEVGRSTVTLTLPSVDEAVTVISNVLVQFDEKKIRSPQLSSFSLKETGIVQLSLSFLANL